MLSRYIKAAMSSAVYHFLEDDRLYYGEIPRLPGVYATGPDREECVRVLKEVLEEWLLIRLTKGLESPSIEGVDLRVREVG